MGAVHELHVQSKRYENFSCVDCINEQGITRRRTATLNVGPENIISSLLCGGQLLLSFIWRLSSSL